MSQLMKLKKKLRALLIATRIPREPENFSELLWDLRLPPPPRF